MVKASLITMDGIHQPARQVLPRVCDWVRKAKAEGSQVAFFPELILGHYIEDVLTLDGMEISILRSLARELDISIGIGICEIVSGFRYSTYVLIDANGDLSVHRKTQGKSRHAPTNFGSMAVTHTIAGIKVGVMICSECLYAKVVNQIVSDRAEILIIPMAYSQLVDPGLNSKTRTLSEIIHRDITAKAIETYLPTVVIAASGCYDRLTAKGLDSYNFEGGCALINEEGDIIIQRSCDQVIMEQFQIHSGRLSSRIYSNRA